MKRWAIVLLAVCSVALLATSVFATPPTAGTYKTLFGTILPGKATESMPADLAEGQLGNMIWAESWGASVLGAQWKVMCPQIASAPVLVFDDVDGSGNGQRAWQTQYSGGTLWLSGTAPWGAGTENYTGPLEQFATTVYKQYVGGQVVGAVTNIRFRGVIDGYTSCYDMAISNAELVGWTPVGFNPLFGPFPPFHGPADCNVIGNHGTYWNVHDVTLTIIGSCAVDTRSSTWGKLKSLYR